MKETLKTSLIGLGIAVIAIVGSGLGPPVEVDNQPNTSYNEYEKE